MSRRAKNDLIVRVRYQNPLPEPPCPPKLLNIPTSTARYAQPAFTDAMFDARLYPMVVDSEFGMPLDLSRFPGLWGRDEDDPAMHPKAEAPIDPRDAFLFEHLAPGSVNGTGSALPNVSWLRKTEYLSKESVNRTSTAVAEPKSQSAPVDVSQVRQVQLIEESFAALEPADLSKIRHPNKPNVRAEATFDIFPDERVWANKYDVYRFSERPGEKELDVPDARLDAAIIRPLQAEDESWLAYYLTEDDQTAQRFKRKRSADDEGEAGAEDTVDFKFIRDYETMKVLHPCTSDFLFVVEDGSTTGRAPGAYYKDIERRMWMRKRRVRKNEVPAAGARWDIIHLAHASMDPEAVDEYRDRLGEMHDPEYWLKRAEAAEAEADMDAEGEADAEGEIDAEGEPELDVQQGSGTPLPVPGQVEVGMGRPGDSIGEVNGDSKPAQDFEETI